MDLQKITLADVKKLNDDISKLKTVTEWKKRVKEFAKKFELTDIEAINIANSRFDIIFK